MILEKKTNSIHGLSLMSELAALQIQMLAVNWALSWTHNAAGVVVILAASGAASFPLWLNALQIEWKLFWQDTI